MPNIVHLDYETYSACDIKTCGGHRYARDPSTEILMIGLALNDEEPVVWVPGNRTKDHNECLRILGHLKHENTLVYAHNATGFEIPITDALFERTTGFKPPAHHQWRCTAAMARTAAMPAALDKLAEALGMAQQKDHRGKALIRKFSIPQKATATQTKKGLAVAARILPQDDPAAFAEFVEYCRQDVRVERDVAKVLKDFELRGDSLATFQLDIEINCRGLPVNLAGIAATQKIVDAETLRIADEFRAITGFEHTQGARFLPWLKERGYTGDDLTAGTVEEQLEEAGQGPHYVMDRDAGKLSRFGDLTEDAQAALLLKQQIGYASIKKLAAMAKLAGPDDNRVRGTLLYHGATTGRWSARNVQPMNFKRPTIPDSEQAYRDICNGMPAWQVKACYGPVLEVISSCVRHFIHDTKGSAVTSDLRHNYDRPMLDADYAGIEPRIVLWLAGQEDTLDEFRQHLDSYIMLAVVIFGGDYATLRAAYKAGDLTAMERRAVGKEGVLGLGFQMGAPKYQGRVWERAGVQLTRKEAITVVKAYRTKNHKVRDLWRHVELAAMQAIRSPGTLFPAGPHLKFFTTKTAGMMCLFMRLPSGRRLCYPKPEIVWRDRLITDPLTDEPVIDPDTGKQMIKRSEGITFWGQLPKSVHYGRCHLYGGLIVENGTQATAADVMSNGARNAESKGYEIAMLVHDEAPSYYAPERGQSIGEYCTLLTTLPKWADGLPIEAEGGVVPFYRK
jgi:DNA polymerase